MNNECLSVSVFKFCKNLGPAYMSDMYSLIEKPHKSRQFKNKLKLLLKSTNMGQNRSSYIGTKFWNKLTNECKLEENLKKFKHKIKDTFFYKHTACR